MSLQIQQGNLVNTRTETALLARDWQSLSITIDGETSPLTGVTAITYGEKQDTQLNYGSGIYPVSKGFGNVAAYATLTIKSYEIEKLLSEATGFDDSTRRPQNFAAFNITVDWANRNDGSTTSDTIYQCTMDTFEKSLSQNDMDSEVTLELNPTAIQWGTVAV